MVSNSMGAMPPNFGDFQVMVAGSPDLRRWTVRCHGPLSYPGYACDAGYGLDRVGRTNEDYMGATTHVAGGSGRDIHFKMYKMANVDRAHNGPLDWMGLFEALVRRPAAARGRLHHAASGRCTRSACRRRLSFSAPTAPASRSSRAGWRRIPSWLGGTGRPRT